METKLKFSFKGIKHSIYVEMYREQLENMGLAPVREICLKTGQL